MLIADNKELLLKEIAKCNKCGFCQTTCPTFNTTSKETMLARGRNQISKEMIERRLSMIEDTINPALTCLLCRGCETNCPPGIRTDEIAVYARHLYFEKNKEDIVKQFTSTMLSLENTVLNNVIRLIRPFKNLNSFEMIKWVMPLLRFGDIAKNANEIIARMPEKSFIDLHKNNIPWKTNDVDSRGFPTPNPSYRTNRKTIGYFVGCGINFLYSHIGKATIELLNSLDYNVISLNNCCCGLPSYVNGDYETARKQASHNVELFNKHNFEFIVTDCSSCASFLKDYPGLFWNDEKTKEKAENFSSKIKDFTELLTPYRDSRGFLTPTIPVRITYHHPCHSIRGQKISPVEFINRLSNVEYVEMEENDWCCGGAGTYNIFNYENSMKVLERKMSRIRQTKADVVLTSCPACILQLSFGARKFSVPVEVKHISEIIL